jgi:pimeloyl-ACP methyl ester carboxylesterase
MHNSPSYQKIHYSTLGDGPDVLLLHGLGGSSLTWWYLAPQLAAAGFRVIMPDLPGHGHSYRAAHHDHYCEPVIYTILLEWIKALPLNDPLFLVGHSFGGLLSLHLSLDRPEQVRAMTLIDPLYTSDQFPPGIRWISKRPALILRALSKSPKHLFPSTIADIPMTGKISPEMRRQIAIDLKRADPRLLHLLPTIPDMTPRLKEVPTTTQVIWGNRDLTLRPSSFPKLASRLPNATHQKISNTGHQPHLTHPDLVNRLIVDFFNFSRAA